jgi:hypothetical protein
VATEILLNSIDSSSIQLRMSACKNMAILVSTWATDSDSNREYYLNMVQLILFLFALMLDLVANSSTCKRSKRGNSSVYI